MTYMHVGHETSDTWVFPLFSCNIEKLGVAWGRGYCFSTRQFSRESMLGQVQRNTDLWCNHGYQVLSLPERASVHTTIQHKHNLVIPAWRVGTGTLLSITICSRHGVKSGSRCTCMGWVGVDHQRFECVFWIALHSPPGSFQLRTPKLQGKTFLATLELGDGVATWLPSVARKSHRHGATIIQRNSQTKRISTDIYSNSLRMLQFPYLFERSLRLFTERGVEGVA